MTEVREITRSALIFATSPQEGLRQPVGHIILVWIAREILEGQDRQGPE